MSSGGNQFPNNAANGNAHGQWWFSSGAGPSFNFIVHPPRPGDYNFNVNWNHAYFQGQRQEGLNTFNSCVPSAPPASEAFLKTPSPIQAYKPPLVYSTPPVLGQQSPNTSTPIETSQSVPGFQAFLDLLATQNPDQNQTIASGAFSSPTANHEPSPGCGPA